MLNRNNSAKLAKKLVRKHNHAVKQELCRTLKSKTAAQSGFTGLSGRDWYSDCVSLMHPNVERINFGEILRMINCCSIGTIIRSNR